jgi:hypothetical protein
VTVGDGAERSFTTGDVILIDDVGTQGHMTKVKGGQQAVAVGVRVADA